MDAKILTSAIKTACNRAIEAEPNLTKWDMIMGDGDCGEGVKGACEAILQLLPAKSDSVLSILYEIINAVDTMGGTLGAILGILLAAFAHAIRSRPKGSNEPLIDVFGPALARAVESLKQHTGAREGDRTVMDVLLPFAATLDEKRDFAAAVKSAEDAANATSQLGAKFGRASYVGVKEGDEQKVPDPGAWALMEIVKGLYDGGKV